MLAEMRELVEEYERIGAKHDTRRITPNQIGETSEIGAPKRLWADGFVRRWGSAAGAMEMLALHQYPANVIRHLFIELDGQADKVPLFDMIADNEDHPEIVDEVLRAGARCPVRIFIGAGSWRELTLHEYVINPDGAPECYCGNHSSCEGFASCTHSGFPRGERRSALYCLSCLRYFKRTDGMVLGFVSRCTIERGRGIINCICGHRVALTKPWQRNLVSVDCLHCRRKIHCNSGLVIGWGRPSKTRKPARHTWALYYGTRLVAEGAADGRAGCTVPAAEAAYKDQAELYGIDPVWIDINGYRISIWGPRGGIVEHMTKIYRSWRRPDAPGTQLPKQKER